MRLEPTDVPTLLKNYGSRDSFQELANAVGIERFRELYLPVAERVAMRLSEIPLSKTAFTRRGGALVCALRSGALAVKLCDKTIFEPTATAARRMVSEPEYKWLSYCASLATVYLIATNAVQIQFEGGEVYSFASIDSLVERCEPYEVLWNANGNPVIQTTYIFLLELFFPGQFEDLGQGMLADLALAINPALAAGPSEPPLAKVVRMAVERTVDDDKAATARMFTEDAASASASARQGTAAGEGLGVNANAPDLAVALVVPAPQSEDATPEATSPERLKALQWLRGLAAMTTLRGEVTLRDDGLLRVTRKALSFGAAATDNYKMLHEAEFVHEKAEGAVLCNTAAAQAYEAYLTAGEKP